LRSHNSESFKPSNPVNNKDGFTIVEIIAVLVLLGLLAGLAIPRFFNMEASATDRAVNSVIAELNGRENLVWAKMKSSSGGYINDAALQATINYDVGTDYIWTNPPGETGGTIEFRGTAYTLNRTPSTNIRHGTWSR
jgi:prepilin-type N-terminal cleavage/methylation domain-containing protein